MHQSVIKMGVASKGAAAAVKSKGAAAAILAR